MAVLTFMPSSQQAAHMSMPAFYEPAHSTFLLQDNKPKRDNVQKFDDKERIEALRQAVVLEIHKQEATKSYADKEFSQALHLLGESVKGNY